jgi:acetoin:2,6-dichlorophenolindophenol oxidoreductase subunit alpha
MSTEMDMRSDEGLLLDIYRRMMLAYKTDVKFRALITSGELQIIYYPPRGQEMIAAATMAALRADDYLVTIYRGLHDHLAKGVSSRKLWAEFAGRATGTCKGKGGPMHITAPEAGVMVTTGIVGSGLPIANGLALASQINGDGRVTVCSFGDGATNIGAFHEALNLASIWKLPVIFLCQNNLYGEHTAYSDSTAAKEIIDKAQSYGMRSVQVNGNDGFLMYRAAKEAVDRARAGEGPTLLEAKTFRFEGHLLGDTSHYIPKEQMALAKALDPVPTYRKQLRELNISVALLDAIDAQIDAEIADAVAFALSSPYPDIAENRKDITAMEQHS